MATSNELSVLIVDDHGLLRSVMTMALESMEGIVVIGQAGNGREAVELATETNPDLVMMDILMPLLDGLEATRRIRRDCPRTKVMVLTGVAGPDAVLGVLRAGATGLIPKTAELTELQRAIRAVGRGEIYVSPELSGPVLASIAARPADEVNADDLAVLSGREREVIQLIGEGQSTREIAGGLYISPKTVAQHKANIVKKLSLRSTRELQILAARRMASQRVAV
ncbi:MAG: response regulator transcription factor [Dehalococcoidia bacterium]